MERLTERKRNYDRTGISKKSLIVEEGIRKGTPSSYCVAIVTKLADLEDSLEQGKLIELPCKPGDTVWLLHQTYTPKTGNAYGITEMKVAEQRGNELNPVWFIIDGEYGITSFSPSSIGKTVFLTEQEALEALEGMKHEKA